jgi:hypothetical protein
LKVELNTGGLVFGEVSGLSVDERPRAVLGLEEVPLEGVIVLSE